MVSVLLICLTFAFTFQNRAPDDDGAPKDPRARTRHRRIILIRLGGKGREEAAVGEIRSSELYPAIERQDDHLRHARAVPSRGTISG